MSITNSMLIVYLMYVWLWPFYMHPCVYMLSISKWRRTDEAKWQLCPKDSVEHVVAVTGVQTVTWLLWSALTSNEQCHAITGSSGTRHSIMTKPMTCHLFNNIYSTEDCSLCHLPASVWSATSLSSSVTSQPHRQESAHGRPKQTFESNRYRAIYVFCDECFCFDVCL